jgi:hypothetical protein
MVGVCVNRIGTKQETQASNLWVWNLDNNSPRKPVAPFRKLDLSDFCRYISDSNDVFEGNGNYRVTDRWKSIAQGGSEIDFPDTDKHLQAYARGITEMELLSPKNATANTQLILVIHEGARPVVDVFILPKSDFPLIPGSLVPLIP